MNRVIALLPALLFLLTACEEDYVRVHIQPKPDGTFVRTIRMWRADDVRPGEIKPPADSLFEGARSHYGKPLPTEDAVVAFRGVFEEVPADIVRERDETTYRNRGGYTIWTSRLGAFAAYRERRPGPTDHWERLRAAAEGVDTGARILAAMARNGLDGEKGLAKLTAWLEIDFPADMKDLLLLFAGDQGPQNLSGDPIGRSASSAAALALQILDERGYLEVGRLPGMMTEETAIGAFVALVAGRMGRKGDTGLEKKLRGFCDERRAAVLYESALGGLGMTADEAGESLEGIGSLLGGTIFGAGSRLEYALAVPAGAEVVSTSGRFDASEGVVNWQDRLDERPVTGIFFVTWADPDREWQEAHLGRVAVGGAALRDYVLWVHALPADRREAWEAEVEKLAPGPDLAGRIASIRVTPPEPAEEPAPEEGARILLEALSAAGK